MFLNLVYPVTVYLVSPTAWNSVLVGGAGRDIGGSLQPKVQWWHCLGLSAQFLFQTTTQIYRRKGTVSPESFNSETVGDLKRIYVQ